jgi:hypothetical protein
MCAEPKDEFTQTLFSDLSFILGAQPDRRTIIGVQLDEAGASRLRGAGLCLAPTRPVVVRLARGLLAVAGED